MYSVSTCAVIDTYIILNSDIFSNNIIKRTWLFSKKIKNFTGGEYLKEMHEYRKKKLLFL